MALGEPIKLRLSVEKEVIYQAEAQARGKPLGTYLRERLEVQDDLAAELAALRRAIDRAPGRSDGTAASADMGVMLELLLLVRSIAGPQKMQMVQQELQRIGLSIWDGSSSKGR
jgi:hypothetical protein